MTSSNGDALNLETLLLHSNDLENAITNIQFLAVSDHIHLILKYLPMRVRF